MSKKGPSAADAAQDTNSNEFTIESKPAKAENNPIRSESHANYDANRPIGGAMSPEDYKTAQENQNKAAEEPLELSSQTYTSLGGAGKGTGEPLKTESEKQDAAKNMEVVESSAHEKPAAENTNLIPDQITNGNEVQTGGVATSSNDPQPTTTIEEPATSAPPIASAPPAAVDAPPEPIKSDAPASPSTPDAAEKPKDKASLEAEEEEKKSKTFAGSIGSASKESKDKEGMSTTTKLLIAGCCLFAAMTMPGAIPLVIAAVSVKVVTDQIRVKKDVEKSTNVNNPAPSSVGTPNNPPEPSQTIQRERVADAPAVSAPAAPSSSITDAPAAPAVAPTNKNSAPGQDLARDRGLAENAVEGGGQIAENFKHTTQHAPTNISPSSISRAQSKQGELSLT